ncbi:cell cycle protein [Alkaliphilus metalliredigens QYMF]|uniref:Peptidoglycan glycosyltransferase RodA n=1 Tax=Alkaliphilus metalliredigens (strain QYMF) TaxID=293826 RepID=A6TMZ7_ALKMQ|nr:rod shape-determining protein RodA [Alkaliphilus metalliredigens]ABR47565.1 cell cycle protein [Alkaliphilus metalliredigens QYMF]
MRIDHRLARKIDFGLIAVVLIICIIGVMMVGSATEGALSNRHIRTQIISVLIGIGAIIAIMLIDYNSLSRMYIPIYILSNALLLAVLVMGTGQEQWGANRWIRIAGFQFQPADFAKIGIIICLAKMIDDNKESIHKIPTLMKIIAFAGLPMLLIMRQPDLGTTMAFASFTFGMLFIAGLRYKHILITGIMGVVSLPFMWFVVLKGYQQQRILTFLNPELDPQGAGYHIIQSKITVGAGRTLGMRLENFLGINPPSTTFFHHFGFLPEKHTDFIFSVIAQELGFVGSIVLLILYAILLIKCMNVAREAKDDFGKYIVTGITFMLAFHIIANIAMTIGLMPVTGKPLPFVSYGGTFMLSNMIALGLVLNVNMRRDKINF